MGAAASCEMGALDAEGLALYCEGAKKPAVVSRMIRERVYSVQLLIFVEKSNIFWCGGSFIATRVMPTRKDLETRRKMTLLGRCEIDGATARIGVR